MQNAYARRTLSAEAATPKLVGEKEAPTAMAALIYQEFVTEVELYFETSNASLKKNLQSH